ncbi:MAG TPA: ATP-dependent DNA helicase [Candidatus Nitrosotenuis sp.]|nr:ATP-dependent DNA helicase [Candidatus Nitrosotenuis sp.]
MSASVIEFPADDSFERLNAAQRRAAEHGDGPLLVVAGAGTGKTKVITARIARLLETQPNLSGENILGLTFTDKAAAEMKRRVVQAVGQRSESVRLGTFHSFCFELLRDVDPAVRVLDNTDHWILLRRNLPRLELKYYRRVAEPGQFLGDFVQFFSRCQDELVSPDDYQRYVDGLVRAHEEQKSSLSEEERAEAEAELLRQQELVRVYRVSEALLRERKLVTYGGLLLGAVRLLEENATLREELRARYRYILVDEFQDTNIAQIELLWLLAAEHKNIFAVGDDDQAIYRFRGASFGSFKLFAQRFAGARTPEEERACAVPLVENYRSTKRILRVAGQVIQQNADRFLPEKQLDTSHDEGAKVRLAEFASADEEAHWVAEEIARLHEQGHRWREFAVLYRMHTHREKLVAALAARAIPFAIRNLSILTNPLVRDVLAYLRLIARPHDNVSCARVLAAPAWGFTASDLVRLCARSPKGSLWESLRTAQAELPFSGGERRAAELVAFVQDFRGRAWKLSAAELLRELLAELGLGLPADDPSAPHLEALLNFVDEWELKPLTESRKLEEFVRYLDDFLDANGSINLSEPAAADAVQLMTVHAAKGLEFDHVFLLRMVAGGFPVRPRQPVLEFPEALMKEARPEGDFHVQEERRLFYVALTRAKRRLTISTVVHRRSKFSPFLEDFLSQPDIARRDVERLTPKVDLSAAPKNVPAAETLFGANDPRSRAFSRIARWAEEFHPPAPMPLQLSASSVESYSNCPQRYLFEAMWGVRGGPRASATFGSVMHLTIREMVKQMSQRRALPFDEVQAIYEREWRSAGFEDDFQEAEYKKEGLEQLRAFHATCAQLSADVLGQEKYFELPLENNIVLTGRMDQVNRVAPGAAEIVDYKTGRPKAERDAKNSLQLSIYALAARDLLELDPVRLTFYNLMNNAAVSASRDAKQLDKALDKVREAAAAIRAGEFPAEPGFQCRHCDFQPICPAHEQLVTLTR